VQEIRDLPKKLDFEPAQCCLLEEEALYLLDKLDCINMLSDTKTYRSLLH